MKGHSCRLCQVLSRTLPATRIAFNETVAHLGLAEFGAGMQRPPRPGWLELFVTASMLALSCLLTACATAPQPLLYQRLGGETGIEAVVHKTITRVSQDPRSSQSFKGIKMPFLIQSIAKHICMVADGPCQYEGDTMRKTHASLNISASQFEFTVTVLREELDAAGISQGAKNELLRRLAPMKTDIVQP
jgi:hemoglobin